MLELPPDLEHQIRQEAVQRGQGIGEYILWLMERYENRKGQVAEETQITVTQSIGEEPAK